MKYYTEHEAKNFIESILKHGLTIRFPNPLKLVDEGKKYKKGFEVRLTAHTYNELLKTQSALELIGFKFGKPFEKHSRFIIPIYGREQVERFIEMFKLFEKKNRI